MPNIDTSTISGFDAMSAEEKVTALLGVEIPEAVDLSQFVSKAVFDKKASEAAELSKRLKAKSTDEENAAAEREAVSAKTAEELKKALETIDALQREKTIATYEKSYIAQGYDEALAKSTAEALASGDMDKVFKNAQTFNAALKKKLEAEMMDKDPHPGGGIRETDPSEDQARRIGQKRAEANKKASEGMKKYTI